MSEDGAERGRQLEDAARDRWPVIIVGGGPVGVALSIELAQRGVRSIVLERTTTLHRIPKGQFLTGRTLEHFHFWKCIEAQRAARVLPRDKQLGTVTAYGALGSEYWYDKSIGTTVQPGFYFEVGDRIEQYLTERVLRDRLAELPVGRMLTGVNVLGVEQDADGVSVTVAPSGAAADVSYSWEIPSGDGTSASEGREVVLRGDYVVGCDGAHSRVREAAGIALLGFDSGKRLTLTRFRSQELSDYLAQVYPDATTYRVLDTGLDGWIGFFGRVDDRGKFFFHAPVPASAAYGPAEALEMMQRVAGREFAAEIDDIRFWHGSIRIAERFRNGRMFIAGDAGHHHPPYGGYGLNNGLEDAVNLGWKLAASAQGWGSDELLGSYDAERRVAFAAIERLMMRGILNNWHFLDAYNPLLDKTAFDAAWEARARHGDEFKFQFESHYGASPVVSREPGHVTGADVPVTTRATAGYHLTPFRLSTRENVFRKLNYEGFTLIALDAAAEAVESFTRAAGELGIPLSVVEDSYGGDRVKLRARLILVRPDQFVAWSGNGNGDGDGVGAADTLRHAVGRA